MQAQDKPVIIKVSMQGCGPCKTMKPIFAKVAQELSSLYDFAELDFHEAKKYNLSLQPKYVPTFYIFYKGKLVAEQSESMSENELKQWISESLSA